MTNIHLTFVYKKARILNDYYEKQKTEEFIQVQME